jgi:hypothetical protein
MTNEQVDRVVQHLCEQLHVAIRLKGTEALPPNARDLAFDAAAVKTVLLSGLRLAGVRCKACSLSVQAKSSGHPARDKSSGRDMLARREVVQRNWLVG